MIKSIVDSCGLSPNTIKVSPFSTCVDSRDEKVNEDSEGRIQGCTAMTAFDTGEGVVNLCQNDSCGNRTMLFFLFGGLAEATCDRLGTTLVGALSAPGGIKFDPRGLV